MPTKIDGDLFLNDINGGIFNSLANVLDENNNWKSLMGVINNFSANSVDRFQRYSEGAGRALLRDLGNGMIVSELVAYLEILKLEKALLHLKSYEPANLVLIPAEKFHIVSGRKSHIELTCKAQGFPTPAYQWFKRPKDKEVLEELLFQINDKLDISPVRKQDEGLYICRVYNQNPDCDTEESVQYSPWIDVEVTQNLEENDSDDISELPEITEHPKSPSEDGFVTPGSTIILTCRARSIYTLTYEWYKDGKIVKDENSDELRVSIETNENEILWIYLCRVFNQYGSILSKPVSIKVKSSIEDSVTVKDKVALIIANQNYDHLNQLHKPIEDAISLAIPLEKLNFKVITLLDLNIEEMLNSVDMFCSLLDDGVIGAFYYVGHGFEINRCCYMLPVDAPVKFSRSGALSSEHVLKKMQEHDIALCLTMFDTCRLEPKCNMPVHKEPAPLFQSTVRCNVVSAYSTSMCSAAYESKSDQNGVFMKHLKKYISLNIPVKELLSKVAEDVNQDSVASHKQYPWVESNLVKKISLAATISDTEANIAKRKEQFAEKMPNFCRCYQHETLPVEIYCTRYREVICNVLTVKVKGDVKLSVLNEEVVAQNELASTKDIYVITNLQRIKSQLEIEIENDGKKFKINLGFPLNCFKK